MVDLFSALRGMFKPIVANSAVALVFEEPAALPRIYTDDKKLSQILRNYISNALKFTAEGEVRIVAQLIEQSAMIEFSVTDTGIGIAAEHLATLFSDFVQIDTRLQRRLRGTGLGLSLAKKLAALLGGRVGATSELGRGSRFWVTVPVLYPGSPPAPESP
jgi:signal transduction histidine kinase